jgi:hypothetical protein
MVGRTREGQEEERQRTSQGFHEGKRVAYGSFVATVLIHLYNQEGCTANPCRRPRCHPKAVAF